MHEPLFVPRGNLSTYKELCSLASDLNQPDLIYKFMHLANHNAIWNSKKVSRDTILKPLYFQGAAFGFSTIASKAGQQLTEHLPKIIPRLYRYRFDPTPRIQNSMASIWHALVPETQKTVRYQQRLGTNQMYQTGRSNPSLLPGPFAVHVFRAVRDALTSVINSLLPIGSLGGQYHFRFPEPMGSSLFSDWTRPGSNGGIFHRRHLSFPTTPYLPPRLRVAGTVPTPYLPPRPRVAGTLSFPPPNLFVLSDGDPHGMGYTRRAGKAQRLKTLKKATTTKQYSTHGPVYYCSHQTYERKHSASGTPSVDHSSPRFSPTPTIRPPPTPLSPFSPEGYHLHPFTTPEPAYVFSPISLPYPHPLDPRDRLLVARKLHFD
uniref:Uncharacterized protein n=1 Tax=Timema shepardi TaxID=629360 RepID=A0A7R9B3R9_TIMSH|nr:unnamed protein product [Timema shepardi]